MNSIMRKGKDENQVKSHNVQPTKKYPSGFFRGVFLFPTGLIISILIGIASGQSIGALWGVIIGIFVFIICVVITVAMINTSKTFTLVDCMLPALIALFAAFVFSPVAIISGNFFSIGTCIFSGVLLSVGLFLYKSDKIQGAFLILPMLTFFYEILPIDLPTDLDNILALGVSTLDMAIGGILRLRQHLVAKNEPELESQVTSIQTDQFSD